MAGGVGVGVCMVSAELSVLQRVLPLLAQGFGGDGVVPVRCSPDAENMYMVTL